MIRAFALLSLSILGFSSPSVFAREAPRAPISLTVSGGVSLGAYQAGMLYYSTRFIRENNLQVELKLVTGASAGAINSFLSVLTACSPEKPGNPSESLFWKTWMPVGFRELLGTSARQKPSAVFTTEALEKSALGVEEKWMAGLDSRCDIVFGITTTLLKPAQLKFSAGILTEHQEEPFVLRIRGQGPGKPPILSNYVDPNYSTRHAILYIPDDPHAQFKSLQNLLLASAAFPGAFPPVKVSLCRTDARYPVRTCTKDLAKEEYFIDGGVFDNEPLRLATRLATRGLEKTKAGFFRWMNAPNSTHRDPPAGLQFKAIDSDAKTYPSEPVTIEENVAEEDAPFILYVEKFIGRFITTARSQQLYSVLEESPELEDSIQSSKNQFPLASEPGLAFAGFFDKGFREYDFFLGMYDAKIGMIKSWGDGKKKLLFPEDTSQTNLDWKLFACVEATLDYRPDHEAACNFPEAYNTKRLLQASFDRLYSTCKDLKPDSDFTSYPNPDCAAAAHGKLPPLVSSELNLTDWKRNPGEVEGLYSLRLLSQNQYHFEIVSKPNASRDEVMATFKSDFRLAFGKLVERQPRSDRLLLDFAGAPALNLINYVPPDHEFHVMIGELVEGGYSLALNRWLRVAGALSFERPQDIFADHSGQFAIAPLVGIELEPKGLSNAWFQPRFGARTGWQFSPRDNWGTVDCNTGNNCSRWIIEPYLSATIYERLRFQFVEALLPGMRGQNMGWNSFFQLGIEFQ